VSSAGPIRFAGMCTVYSKNAIPQLTSAAMYQGRCWRALRCRYHAVSMKRLETTSSKQQHDARPAGHGGGVCPVPARRATPARAGVLALLPVLALSCRVPQIDPAGATSAGNEVARATGFAGVVSSASPEATAAGVAVLAAGGNAIDAAVAVSMALAVTEPSGSGLAGQTFFLVHPPAGSPLVIHGTSYAPASIPEEIERSDLRGRRAASVPSHVAVLDTVWRRFGSGRLSWSRLLEPAIRYAEEGFRLGRFRQRSVARYARALRRDPVTARIFLGADGAVPAEGSLVRQPALAGTLRRLAEAGADDFYRGSIARTIARDMERHGGWITFEDLAGFPEPRVVEPLRGTYRGLDVATLPPPAGGWVVLQALGILEAAHPGAPPESRVERTIWTAEALRAAHGSRLERPVEDLRDYEDDVRRRIRPERAREIVRDIDEEGSGETTHFCVVDGDGFVVAVTQSLNAYFGARVVCEELGLLYNDYLRELVTGDPDHPFAVRPGAMPYSSMSATVLSRDGRPVLALGSPGSRRIISAVVQVVRKVVEDAAAIGAAVAAPRIHAVPEEDGLLFEVRPRSRALLAALEERGFRISIPLSSLNAGELDPYFGGVHAVALEDGAWRGAADPRRDGVATRAVRGRD